MGFYLPGIGEAIGGALRMKRQGELMEQSQKVLQDDTKPWSERVAMVTAAHPELATNPQLQAMLEAGRQADQDKMAKAKFDREEAAAASAQRFRDLLGKTPAEQQKQLILNNPDMASQVVPELLKTYQGEVEALAEEDRWLRRNEITSGQKDRRAQVAAGAAANNKALDRYLAGQMDAAGNLISPEQQAATKQAQVLAVDEAKKRTTETIKAETAVASLDKATQRQAQLLEELQAMRADEGVLVDPITAQEKTVKEAELVELEARKRTPPGAEINDSLRNSVRSEFGFDKVGDETQAQLPTWLGGGTGLNTKFEAWNAQREQAGLPPLKRTTKAKKKAFKPAAGSVKQ